MGYPKLWLSFYSQDTKIDLWALYLDTADDADCDIWQASGQTYEFERVNLRNTRPENMAHFKFKWLAKEDLTEPEVATVRDVAGNHPVDNDGSYWDCRIFCFEILAALEKKGVLERSDHVYRRMRKMLHEKWKADDGISAENSEDAESDDGANVNKHVSDRTRADTLDHSLTVGSCEEAGDTDRVLGRKRALSRNSNTSIVVDSKTKKKQLDPSLLNSKKRATDKRHWPPSGRISWNDNNGDDDDDDDDDDDGNGDGNDTT